MVFQNANVMKGRTVIVFFCIIALATAALSASSTFAASSEGEGLRKNSILLSGGWKFASGREDERAETPAGAGRLQWQSVNLPGTFMPWSESAVKQTRCIWTRRLFTVSAAQAASLAVLRWNQISNGAVAFINGRKVGENAPTGPYQVILPAGLLKEGENSIVLKVLGPAAVPRAKSGSALIPAGFGPSMPAVHGDVWIDFAEDAYMKWILALPDVASGKVRIRVTLAGIRPDWLSRWNGLPGTVALGNLDGPALAKARTLLWALEPNTCVAAEIPVTDGKGTVLVSQLGVQQHVNRSRPNYDPVAEKILINMLQGKP